MDSVLSFIILTVHMPGKANSAADFLFRVQTDPSLCLSIKLTHRAPIEVGTEAKTPDVSLSNIDKMEPFSNTSQLTVDATFISQLQRHGL